MTGRRGIESRDGRITSRRARCAARIWAFPDKKALSRMSMRPSRSRKLFTTQQQTSTMACIASTFTGSVAALKASAVQVRFARLKERAPRRCASQSPDVRAHPRPRAERRRAARRAGARRRRARTDATGISSTRNSNTRAAALAGGPREPASAGPGRAVFHRRRYRGRPS